MVSPQMMKLSLLCAMIAVFFHGSEEMRFRMISLPASLLMQPAWSVVLVHPPLFPHSFPSFAPFAALFLYHLPS